MKKAKFGEYWIAEISFFKNNPKHRYVVFIEQAKKGKDEVLFMPFLRDELACYNSSAMHSFELIEKLPI